MSAPETKLRLTVGGAVNPRTSVYIVRPSDDELLALLERGEYCNVLCSRQMGKTSLLKRTRARLVERGYATAEIEVAGLLGSPKDADEWYQGLLDEIARQLRLPINVPDWWRTASAVTANQKLIRFFREEVIARIPSDKPVIIFLDEIDSTLKLPYTDDFFVAIRAMYNDRASDPVNERIAFCLVGVATPNELIKERRTTPYNIGRTIELRDFDPDRDDLSPIYRSLCPDEAKGEATVRTIIHETGGHPYLTLRVCDALARRDCAPPAEAAAAVRETFGSLDAVKSDVHFDQMLRFLNERVDDKLSTLDLYRRVLGGNPVPDQTTPAHINLKLIGLAKRDVRGNLVPRSLVYRRLFSDAWARSAMPPVETRARTYKRKFVAAVPVLILTSYLSLSAWLNLPPFRAYLHEPSSEVSIIYREAINSMRDGDFYKSSELLEKALKLDDKFEMAHAKLAEAYMELGYDGKETVHLAQLSLLVPNREKLPARDGLSLSATLNTASRKYPEAIENYREIERLTPRAEKPSVYFDLGRAFEKNQQPDQAIEQYRKALEINPRYAPAQLRLGVLFGRKNDLDSAKASFNSAEENYRATGNIEGEAWVSFWRGLTFSEHYLLAEAYDDLNVALEKAGSLNLKPLAVMARIQRASDYISESKLTEAKSEVDQAIEMAKKENLKNLLASGLIKLADSYHSRSDYDTAENYYKQARDLAAESEGFYNKALAQGNLGSLLITQQRIDEGLREVREARDFFEKNGYQRQALGVLLVTARAQRKKGDYVAALQAYEELRLLANQLHDRVIEARAFFGTALLLEDQDQFAKAFRLYEQSNGLYQSSGMQLDVSYALLNQANLGWKMGDYPLARSLRDQAIATAQRLDEKASKFVMTVMIPLLDARIAYSELNIEQARSKSDEALKSLNESQPEEIIAAKCTHCLATAISGTPQGGRTDCSGAVTLARKINDDRMTAEALLALSIAFVEKGEWQEALDAALPALATFSKLKKPETEWRALLVAARANQSRKDFLQSRRDVLRAEGTLKSLEQMWGEQAYRQYLNRKDIQRQIKQLNELLIAKP